jgi:hypothetical protein
VVESVQLSRILGQLSSRAGGKQALQYVGDSTLWA